MGIYEDVKQMMEIIQKSDNIDLVKKMIDIQKQAMDLMEENRTLKEENKSLQENLKAKETMILENGFYWMEIKNQNETEKEGPFCPGCWVEKSKPVPLVFDPDNRCEPYRKCPNCEVKFILELVENKIEFYPVPREDRFGGY